MSRAIVVLGSNVDPERNVARAMERLRERYEVVAEAAARWTEPVGPAGQASFVNAAAVVRVPYRLEQLKSELREVERELGRVRTEDRYAARVIDLDVVSWDGAVVDPDVAERAYLRELIAAVTSEG